MNTNFRDFHQIPHCFCPITVVVDCEDLVDTSELSRLCDLIYKANPNTRLAESDLSFLASDSVNPEIAAWVRQNLLQPVDFGEKSIYNGKQIDDETILRTTRDIGESVSDYALRMQSFINNEGSN